MINLLTAPKWNDYELIDSGDGKRLERFGKYTLSRPDPQAIWKPMHDFNRWNKVDARYQQHKNGKGSWEILTQIPDQWVVKYNNIGMYARLSPFKHTGIFPEQAIQWDWITQVFAKSSRTTNVLNLFAYTGGATLVCAQLGAKVTHLDASKPAISWARENQKLSGLSEKPIRWIPDDATKFVAREIKRGVKYDGIIMDPPVYGHGPSGEMWDFYRHFPTLLKMCRQLLTPEPLFLIVNAYAISASSIMLQNLMSDLHLKGNTESGELALSHSGDKRLFSTGIFARWTSVKV